MILLRLVSAMLLVAAISSRADEGMWLFNNPPLKQLKEKYQFEPTPQWLEHLQKSSVRFNSGGSGSFVSATGLCITNHHVGADALQKASSEQHNYLKEGFYAKTNAEEIKCADLELNVLISIEDVTAQVNAAVKTGMPPDTAGKARENAIAQIEKESKDKTGLRSDVVTLYQGGAYHLYRYKRYDDVRSFSRPNSRWPSTAAIPIISSIPASISISVFSGRMKTAARQNRPLSEMEFEWAERWRTNFR